MTDRIPLLVPRMPKAHLLLPYLQQIDERQRYTNFGPLSEEFERRIVVEVAPNFSVRNITSVSNGTVGLELSLKALGLRRNSSVLIPSISFVATAASVRRMGLIPVFADVDPLSWSLTPEIAEVASRGRTISAVMPVATFGRAQDAQGWDDLTRKTGIPVVIDAAGAFGNQSVGMLTDVVFSFHATKTLGAAEGGAVLSANEERIRNIRRLSNFGIDTSVGEACDIGTNGKLSEYHAAVGLASFDQWEETKRDRVVLSQRYSERLRHRCPSLSHQQKPADGVYAVLSVLLPNGSLASTIAKQLGTAGIETRRWYCPALHLQPAFSDCPTAGHLCVAEDISKRLLGLPFFLQMTDRQIDAVCDQLTDALTATG